MIKPEEIDIKVFECIRDNISDYSMWIHLIPYGYTTTVNISKQQACELVKLGWPLFNMYYDEPSKFITFNLTMEYDGVK